MRCNKCKCEMPYDSSLGYAYECIYCEGTQYPTAEDFLSNSNLKLVSETRPAQIQLSKLIDQAFYDNQTVIIEAGTGVGKSFAYLLPAILSGKRAVISTAKKSLQSQLLEKDLPYIQKTLLTNSTFGQSFSFAPAYGKSNYVCRRLVKQAPTATKKSLERLLDYSDYGMWEEASNAFARATGRKGTRLPLYDSAYSVDNCTGTKCPYQAGCGYLKARKEMLGAKIVVANHWLVGYHFRLKQEIPTYELLGAMDYLIIDEAHKLEDGIRSAFTHEIRENALKQLFDSYESFVAAADNSNLPDTLPFKAALMNDWDELFSRVRPRKYGDDSIITTSDMGEAGGTLAKSINAAALLLCSRKFLKNALQIPDAEDALYTRILRVLNERSPTEFTTDEEKIPGSFSALNAINKGASEEIYALRNLVRGLDNISSALEAVYSDEDDNRVTYIENLGKYCAIQIAPIEIAPMMAAATQSLNSVVYVSATLAINNSMDVFRKRVGVPLKPLPTVVVSQFGSAFDLSKQALLYLSETVPEPTRNEGTVDEYRRKLADEIYDLITANNGNAFVLFTARDEMKDVYNRLVSRGTTLPIIMQDDTSAATLLQQYRSTDNAVLLGLKSFWEGVDVAGDKLSLVIITKLPFPSRSDPVITARRAKAGDEWFSQVDIPDMTLDLRQGVGRLIRTQTDRGVIAILDQRMLTKRYKTQVLRSIGLTQVTKSKASVLKALTNLAKHRRVGS